MRSKHVSLSVVLCLLVSSGLAASSRNGVVALSLPLPPPTAAPAEITATAGDGRVALAWSAVEGATGYRIFRSTTGVWDLPPFKTVSGTVYTNTGLSNGTPYAYRVAAYTDGGAGPLSAVASATPMAAPAGVTAVRGDRQVTLAWQPATGALSYTIYRSLTGTIDSFVEIASGIEGLSFVNTDLTNGTTYYYRLRAIGNGGVSALSAKVYATPQPPPPATAPSNFTATPGNARVTLAWGAVEGATRYRIFRSTTDVFDAPAFTTTTALTYKNTGLINGTEYFYQILANNPGGNGPASVVVSAMPMAPPAPPEGVTATAGNAEVTLHWLPVPTAATYNVYRGTAPGRQASLALALGLADPTFHDSVANGPTYYYKVTAVNVGGQSLRSAEVFASPEAPAPAIDPETLAVFRVLRQATWGPRPGDVDSLKTSGVDAFLAEQLGQAPSIFPDALFDHSVEASQEHFMQLALTGPDQLRQRVAWALHKIWVVSAVEVGDADAIVTYYRILLNGAFGNYRDLMRAVTLNPAMGRYLNMLNNRSQLVTGVPPNENYARELMQLFTLGLSKLNPNGTPMLDAGGRPLPTFSETDVKELARIFTGWTFGDGDPATTPWRLAVENNRVPMEAVERYHDAAAKSLLGGDFAAGQSAVQDLDQALDLIFNHPNVGPFISRQLIQQLVTSNPSPAYVAAVAAVFNDNGGGVRGDLAAVVRAVLTHPEAALSTDSSGKLSEPVLFVVSQLRALNAAVTDHPFMSDKAEEMGQKVFYPPSVFSYFSPGYRVRGTVGPAGLPLGGPEFQIMTAVTALVRVNFVGALVAGWFGADVAIDYTPFTSRANDPAALVDFVNLLFMAGRMSIEQRTDIIAAVRVSPSSRAMERVRTAIYLTLVAAQAQVDR